MNERDVEEGAEDQQAFYDATEARLGRLDAIVAAWGPREGAASGDGIDDDYREAGRLTSRLEATRKRVERMKDVRDDWRLARDDVEQAITELEEAVAKAAPRFQG